MRPFLIIMGIFILLSIVAVVYPDLFGQKIGWWSRYAVYCVSPNLYFWLHGYDPHIGCCGIFEGIVN